VAIEPGQQLLHYRLIEKIGEGGMGMVWKAVDTDLGREVAIKVLPEVFAGDAERLTRFEREARLLASLSHPGIAAIYGLHECDTSTGSLRFLAMELVQGEDLSVRKTVGLSSGRSPTRGLARWMFSASESRDLSCPTLRASPSRPTHAGSLSTSRSRIRRKCR
jgi:serine/threonine protein kinase